MTECAVFAAVLCIFSPITLPVGPVPVTLGLFAVMLAGIMLRVKESVVAVLVFVLLGLCGLPVFSGAKGGFAVLAGQTGGYIWSYFICSFIISLICHSKQKNSVFLNFVACVFGIAVCYIFGTAQFTILTQGFNFFDSLKVCVYPFIAFDLIKALCASVLGKTLKKRMRWFV